MEKVNDLLNEREDFNVGEVLRVFWRLQTQKGRLDFLLDEKTCPDQILSEMLNSNEFVLFLFRNAEITKGLDARISSILARANDGNRIAAVLPISYNLERLDMDHSVLEVRVEVRKRIYRLILEIADDNLFIISCEEGPASSNVFGGLSIPESVNIILESGDAELAGELGLFFAKDNKFESAIFYLQRAVDLGAKKYQVDLAIVFFHLVIKGCSRYSDDCLLNWEKIEYVSDDDYNKLVACVMLMHENSFFLTCLSKLKSIYLRNLLAKLKIAVSSLPLVLNDYKGLPN